MKELFNDYDNMDLEATDPVTMDDDTFKDIEIIQKGLERLIMHEESGKREFETSKRKILLLEKIEMDNSKDDRKLGSSQYSDQNITNTQNDGRKLESSQATETGDESIIAEVLPQDGNEHKGENNKLQTIIETFTSIGEFLFFPESETVVTHPRFFCRELVKYIIIHEVLSLDEDFSNQDLESFEKSLYSEEGIDPKDRDKLLKRGFYLKVSIEECAEDKREILWNMMKVTGLGIELSPIRMFIPLLISESCWKMMAQYVKEFQKKMEKEEFKFLIRFDFDGSMDFFSQFKQTNSTKLQFDCSIL